jgi:hypothetical protein
MSLGDLRWWQIAGSAGLILAMAVGDALLAYIAWVNRKGPFN